MSRKKKLSENENNETFVARTLEVYQLLEDEINEIRKVKMKKNVLPFRELVKASYVKTYDYIIYLCSNPNHEDAFFKLPMLRSICEDFISITYLISTKSETERDKFISDFADFSMVESIIVQERFMKRHNPAQIIIPSTLVEKNKKDWVEDKPKQNNHAIQKGYPVLPSVFKMSEEINYKELYRFIYYATSKLVHFSPDTLLKMGWGEIDKKTEILSGEFSYRNYSKYYYAFSIFYASYLFIHQTKEFSKIIDISDESIKITQDLFDEYKKVDWVEITTFEQLNLPRPNPLVRALNRVALESKTK